MSLLVSLQYNIDSDLCLVHIRTFFALCLWICLDFFSFSSIVLGAHPGQGGRGPSLFMPYTPWLSQCFAMIYAIVRPRSNRISTHFSISSNKWASQVANFEDIHGSTNRVYRKCIRPTSWRWACLTQISSDHETIFTIYHVRIHVHLSSMIVFLGL